MRKRDILDIEPAAFWETEVDTQSTRMRYRHECFFSGFVGSAENKTPSFWEVTIQYCDH